MKTIETKFTDQQRAGALTHAQDQLREALRAAKHAGSPLLAERCRAAIKSCDGALRHAEKRAAKSWATKTGKRKPYDYDDLARELHPHG